MIKVVINADDLGVSPVVNYAIERALERNEISSTTIIANSAYMDDVIRIVNKYKGEKSFGVHLNITEGKSLTNSPVLKNAGMIDEYGNFVRRHNFESRIYDPLITDAVEREWDAQVNEVLSKGIEVSHLDGHHHCHTWYGYTPALVSIMKKYKIGKVRNTYLSPFVTRKGKIIKLVSCFLLNSHILDASKEMKMNHMLASIRHCQDRFHYCDLTSDFEKSDFFDSYESFFEKQKKTRVGDSQNNDIVIELMCHPGHEKYREEFALIQRDAIGIRTNNKYRLITYNEL